jgi:glycosyltransferase involved in cell wall biosynthesis
MSGLLHLILDVIDIPAYIGREKGKWKVFPALIHEAICLEIATVTMATSPWYREYFLRRSPKAQVEVIPMSSFSQLIKPVYRRGEKNFNVLYVGPLEKERGIDRLVECIEKINSRYENIHLILATSPRPKIRLPERKWLKVYFHIPSYLHLIDIVLKSDIGIIPYPLNSYWDGEFMAKISLYMAAGKGIISTNLKETKEKLLKWKCGLIGEDWEEIGGLIIKLAQSPELTLQLGKNAREAAEKEYNWQVQTNQLNRIIRNLK